MPKFSLPFARQAVLALVLLGLSSAPLAVQAQEIEAVDPSAEIDGDLVGPSADAAVENNDPQPVVEEALPSLDDPDFVESAAQPTGTQAPDAGDEAANTTYKQDDLIGAAEGVFGKGAQGLGRLIEKLLKEQGEPNGYIVGREGGGALVVGVRYGSGTLYHKVEGQMPVYWTGPSIGFDAGANAGNTFILVYNLHDTEELYERFPSGEGQAYFVGGFNVSYLRKGKIVMIPIRVGAGLRLGVNAGYMRFSKKQRWLPF